ncbi:MAG: pyruvate formate lyase-activating protein [Clostridia bacterium]|nr:pyruvate formate lyase-activating protein [Clostridia bacterium]
MELKGKIHSFQSLGTVDGPGVRFVVFMQGCPLRCGCCHNPDTWDINGGKEYACQEILDKIVRFKDYFGQKGGVTVSGGEPLLQAKFVTKLFKICKDNGINTCLDTSGCVLNDEVKELLNYCDTLLLDVKYTQNSLYLKHVGCSIDKVLSFLEYANLKQIPTVIRQVIIPTLNDNEQNILYLKDLQTKFSCVHKIELLPFKKICQVKYDNLKLDFAFKDISTPSNEQMQKLNKLLL